MHAPACATCNVQAAQTACERVERTHTLDTPSVPFHHLARTRNEFYKDYIHRTLGQLTPAVERAMASNFLIVIFIEVPEYPCEIQVVRGVGKFFIQPCACGLLRFQLGCGVLLSECA
eukprot:scpid87319/ scgid26913/ 